MMFTHRPHLQAAMLAMTAAIAIAILSACGSKKEFKININMSENIERMVVMTYNTSSGVKQTTAQVVDGKATLIGDSRDYTAAALVWIDGEPLAKCIVRNGDKVDIKFSTGSPAPKISGSRPTEAYNQFIADNSQAIASGDVDALNRNVEAFVAAHPNDPAALQVLMDYFYLPGHENRGDSLLAMIETTARPATLLMNYGVVNSAQMQQQKPERIYQFGLYTARDSFMAIKPNAHRLTLLAFLSTVRKTRRHQVDRLKAINDSLKASRGQLVEISLKNDSALWRQSLGGDSATWIQGWMPGNVSATALNRMKVPREPFYILVDSTGAQLYRGSNVDDALKIIVANAPGRSKK